MHGYVDVPWIDRYIAAQSSVIIPAIIVLCISCYVLFVGRTDSQRVFRPYVLLTIYTLIATVLGALIMPHMVAMSEVSSPDRGTLVIATVFPSTAFYFNRFSLRRRFLICTVLYIPSFVLVSALISTFSTVYFVRLDELLK